MYQCKVSWPEHRSSDRIDCAMFSLSNNSIKIIIAFLSFGINHVQAARSVLELSQAQRHDGEISTTEGLKITRDETTNSSRYISSPLEF